MALFTFIFINAWIAFVITAIWFHVTKPDEEPEKTGKREQIYYKSFHRFYDNHLN